MTNEIKTLDFLIYKLKKNYKYLKVLFVIDNNAMLNYENEINKLYQYCYNYDVISFPPNINKSDLTYNLIKARLTDDVRLFVVIGEHNLFDLVDDFGEIEKIFIPTTYSIYNYKYHCKYLIIDDKFLNKLSKKMFANCFAELGSLYVYVIEKMFNISIYNNDDSFNEILLLNKEINNLIFLPTKVLNGKMGQQKFQKICYEISKIINFNNLENSVLNTLKQNLITGNKYKGLLNGEALLIAGGIILEILMFIFNTNQLDFKIKYNYYDRLLKAKRINKNLTTSIIANNFSNFNYEDKKIMINYTDIKKEFYNVLIVYQKKYKIILNTFANLQYDKGISLKKYIHKSCLLNAINKLPEQAISANLSTFVREFGLLNKF